MFDRLVSKLLTAALCCAVSAAPAFSAENCSRHLSNDIPSRDTRALGGSTVMQRVMNLGGTDRDSAVVKEVLAGNVPDFLRRLTPVSFTGQSGGRSVVVTICVTPDYLAVGSDSDFVRIPMGLPAAARIADSMGFFLPTPKMVDAIYAQAAVHLAPSPMKPTRQMSSTTYLLRHNQTVSLARDGKGEGPEALTAGQKKDIVLSTRLRAAPGRVAIYGWHRPNGKPIQPLSTVHGAQYADYSHGVRLVSQTAFVNGQAVPLAEIMQDPKLAAFVSSEGPIANARGFQASLYH